MSLTPCHVPILIIGSGPAGYTAAIYAARANLSPILVTGIQSGGQLTITTDVENYPGFENPIQGPWLMEQMKKQAENVGTQIDLATITQVDFSQYPLQAIGDNGVIYHAKSIVIATGAQAKWLGLESEKKFNGRGVSACATCDGSFYKKKQVAVVGGGNTAVEEALYLSNIASHVTLIHRRDSLRAEKILQDRLKKTSNIDIIWNHEIQEIQGDSQPYKGVEKVVLKHTQNQSTQSLCVEGIFVAIGHEPNTKIFKNQLKIDEEGYITTLPNSTQTSVSGVYAAGDVQDKVYRQAVTAAGMGCMAALEIEKFLSFRK